VDAPWPFRAPSNSDANCAALWAAALRLQLAMVAPGASLYLCRVRACVRTRVLERCASVMCVCLRACVRVCACAVWVLCGCCVGVYWEDGELMGEARSVSCTRGGSVALSDGAAGARLATGWFRTHFSGGSVRAHAGHMHTL